MKLKRVGFFSDLRYGDSTEGPITCFIDAACAGEQVKELQYLKSGHTLIASPGFSRDVLSPEKIIGPLAMLTDGEYVWPSDLAYYVEHYRVKLPRHFLEHIKERNWLIGHVDLGNLDM